jgi:hypothetical protein
MSLTAVFFGRCAMAEDYTNTYIKASSTLGANGVFA